MSNITVPPRTRSAGMRTIDIHAHITDPEVLVATHNHSVFSGFGAIPRPSRPTLDAQVQDPKVHLADQIARRVDLAVLVHSTVHQPTGWAELETQLRLTRRMNDVMLGWVAHAPDRFIGSIIPTLADMPTAIAELERYAAAGLRLVEAPARVGEYLGHPNFWPFWDAAQRLKLPVFIHPEGTSDPWFQNYSLWNSLGQSFEESKVMASLIYEGTLDKFPDVQIVMAHGGGYFPHNMGRVDRNVAKPAAMKNITLAPSTYLRRFHYDSCLYDPIALKNLIERVGADRVVLGSDFPFGEMDPMLSIEALDIPDSALPLIAHKNMERLLGL